MLKKLRTLISSQHALMLAYRAEIYLWVLAHVLPFIMMALWTNAASLSPPGRFAMSPHDYARYYISVFITRQFTAAWMIYEFEYHIVEGRLSYLLLRPINPLWHYVSAHLGEQLARLPFFAICLVAFFLVYPDARWTPSPSAITLGILAIYAAFAMRFALQYCLAMLTFWFERASSIDQLTFLPYIFLSGLAVPLADFPPHLAALVKLTPFPYMIDFPARILMGTLTPSDPELLTGLLTITTWFLALSLLGALLWRLGLRRYAGQGA